MWICLNDAFLSIVKKDCARDELLVRARRPGDIEKVFPEAKGRVVTNTRSDYAYRAVIKAHVVKTALDGEVNRINYSNFKDSVSKDDEALHDAYMAVWMAMSKLQPTAPYSGFLRGSPEIGDSVTGAGIPKGAKFAKAADDYNKGKIGPYAKKLSHPGRAKGGRARAASMTAAERSAQARRAANIRWGNLSGKGD